MPEKMHSYKILYTESNIFKIAIIRGRIIIKICTQCNFLNKFIKINKN